MADAQINLADDTGPDPGEVIVVTLRSEGDGPPIAIRARRGLKMLLRGCGL